MSDTRYERRNAYLSGSSPELHCEIVRMNQWISWLEFQQKYAWVIWITSELIFAKPNWRRTIFDKDTLINQLSMQAMINDNGSWFTPCSPNSLSVHRRLLGVSAACRESFHVFTLRICFTTQPAGPATYCRGKARYSWIIFRKISPYKLLRHPVQGGAKKFLHVWTFPPSFCPLT